MNTPLSGITGSSGSRARHDRIQAQATAKAGLRNSLGWKRMPKSSQRRAPFTSAPISGTSSSAHTIAVLITIVPRRTSSRGRSEVPSSTSRPRNWNRKCSQKKYKSPSSAWPVERRRALAGEAAATEAAPTVISASTRNSSGRSSSRHQICSCRLRLCGNCCAGALRSPGRGI
jgi:hypothetical protein